MGLSKQESKTLERLMAKKDAPDEPAVGRSVNVSIDLGDAAQVERAQKLGLLGMLNDDDDDNDDNDDDDDDNEDIPRRRGYFNNDK